VFVSFRVFGIFPVFYLVICLLLFVDLLFVVFKDVFQFFEKKFKIKIYW